MTRVYLAKVTHTRTPSGDGRQTVFALRQTTAEVSCNPSSQEASSFPGTPSAWMIMRAHPLAKTAFGARQECAKAGSRVWAPRSLSWKLRTLHVLRRDDNACLLSSGTHNRGGFCPRQRIAAASPTQVGVLALDPVPNPVPNRVFSVGHFWRAQMGLGQFCRAPKAGRAEQLRLLNYARIGTPARMGSADRAGRSRAVPALRCGPPSWLGALYCQRAAPGPRALTDAAGIILPARAGPAAART